IEFWRRRLPNPIEVVHYEETVSDPESVARRVYDLVGLDFDPAYLKRLEENADYVEHLSPGHSLDFPTPVREDFVGVGERFRHHLGELVEAYQRRRGRSAAAQVVSPDPDPRADRRMDEQQEDEMQPTYVEKFGAVALRNGMVRIQCLAVGADGKERVTGELMLPANQYGTLVGALQRAGEQLQERQRSAAPSDG
ncbi:sulfotransferase, partial [Halorhodospira sp. 9622]|uniref:sulfotransferase n=1 Tax=Halorhodospira sp. 9622 TaxID=2899136 RepID=UPI001EE9A263